MLVWRTVAEVIVGSFQLPQGGSLKASRLRIEKLKKIATRKHIKKKYLEIRRHSALRMDHSIYGS